MLPQLRRQGLLAKQTAAATKEIAKNVEQASVGIQDVNKNVNQSLIVSSTISRDITEVNRTTREISTNNKTPKPIGFVKNTKARIYAS